jgi:CDP-diacylglycerol--glycerol-3-phosphate 3-phosphatidyltransferase
VPENTLSLIEKNTLATFTFLLAAITDWLDGFLARRLQQTSKFGAFLDPVADKLIVITALLLLLELGRVNSVIALIIIGREFTVSSLREWMAQLGKSQSIAVAFIGKLKTTAQMAAIIFLLYFENIGFIPTQKIGEILIYLAALLTVVSMFYYLRISINAVKKM